MLVFLIKYLAVFSTTYNQYLFENTRTETLTLMGQNSHWPQEEAAFAWTDQPPALTEALRHWGDRDLFTGRQSWVAEVTNWTPPFTKIKGKGGRIEVNKYVLRKEWSFSQQSRGLLESGTSCFESSPKLPKFPWQRKSDCHELHYLLLFITKDTFHIR